MDNKTINGFEKEQVFQLYSYLVAYEESGIQNYKSTTALLRDHPELSDLKTQINAVKCRVSNSEDMKIVDFKKLHNEIYFTREKGNLLLSFLAHLRNAIAHGTVVKHGNSILITDFANPRFRPIDFTARGCVDIEIVNGFTRILSSVVL